MSLLMREFVFEKKRRRKNTACGIKSCSNNFSLILRFVDLIQRWVFQLVMVNVISILIEYRFIIKLSG